MKNGGYAVTDRIIFMMEAEHFTAGEIMQRFEVTRSAIMRDIKYLRTFQNYRIVWDNYAKVYRNCGRIKP